MQRLLTPHTLHGLAAILGVTVGDLVNVDGARPGEPLSSVKAKAPKRGRKPKAASRGKKR